MRCRGARTTEPRSLPLCAETWKSPHGACRNRQRPGRTGAGTPTPRRFVPCPYVAPGHPVRRPISSTWSPFDPSPGLLGMAGRPSVHAARARDQASQSSQSTQAGMAGFVPERWWVVGGGLTHKPTTTTWGGAPPTDAAQGGASAAAPSSIPPSCGGTSWACCTVPPRPLRVSCPAT